MNPLFDFLDQKRMIIEKKSPGNEEEEHTKMMAGIEWSFNKTHLSKINSLSEIVSHYSKKAEEISKRSNEFFETANAFLRDSGKTLNFSAYGELVFKLDGDLDQDERELRTLSSGEVQLIVILTHLYFNPEG